MVSIAGSSALLSYGNGICLNSNGAPLTKPGVVELPRVNVLSRINDAPTVVASVALSESLMNFLRDVFIVLNVVMYPN